MLFFSGLVQIQLQHRLLETICPSRNGASMPNRLIRPFCGCQMQMVILGRKSGEPEHFSLTRPIQWDRIGAGEFATGKISWLSAIHDGCDNIRCQP